MGWWGGGGPFYIDRYGAPKVGGRKRNKAKSKQQRASRRRNR